jgi:hypothetical protein
MYGELRILEDDMTRAGGTAGATRELTARLDRLEKQANYLRLPAVAYASMLYSLRDHIGLVRAIMPVEVPIGFEIEMR